MGLTINELLEAVNSPNGIDKRASQKEAMPPAATVHKSPMNQPSGESHELEAALGDAEADRREILKDRLMQAAGSAKADESREDPDEAHNASIESKAKELMPPAGDAGEEHQGPETEESKISSDWQQLSTEYAGLAEVAQEAGDEDLAGVFAQKAAAYNAKALEYSGGKTASGVLSSILGGKTVDTQVSQKEAEEQAVNHMLKLAGEYYACGEIFARGFLDTISVAQKTASEPVVDDAEKVAALEEKVDVILEFLSSAVEDNS